MPSAKVLGADRENSDDNASEVVICEKHEKRFLLGIYMKIPRVRGSLGKELSTAASVLKLLEEPSEVQGNDSMPVAVTTSVAIGKEDEDRGSLVSTEPDPKC
jgi:hypothetical protein